MRVIAGSAKGTTLAPVPPGVRPVSDRAREGLFSSLAAEVDGARVLDLFAGTGALAIEALSRGADRAVLVERDPRAAAMIRENLDRTHMAERARIVRAPVARFLERPSEEEPFELVFLDPPYTADPAEIGVALRALTARPMLADDATVVLTRDSRSSNDVIPVDWLTLKRLTYGDSVVTLCRPRKQPRTTEE